MSSQSLRSAHFGYTDFVLRLVPSIAFSVVAGLLASVAGAQDPGGEDEHGPPVAAPPVAAPPEPPVAAPPEPPVAELPVAEPPVGVPRGGTSGAGVRPQALNIDYVTYGVAISGDFLVNAGAPCREDDVPCIFGSGGGLVLRGGYRSPGPWWVGGAYQFSTTDSSNLYRLGTLQQLRAEMRYSLDLGYRTSPYATWGLGGVVYGSEFGAETGGGTAFLGLGFETQLSRVAHFGGAVYYQPMVFAGFEDTAGFTRAAGLTHTVRVELQVELRSELSRD